MLIETEPKENPSKLNYVPINKDFLYSPRSKYLQMKSLSLDQTRFIAK